MHVPLHILNRMHLDFDHFWNAQKVNDILSNWKNDWMQLKLSITNRLIWNQKNLENIASIFSKRKIRHNVDQHEIKKIFIIFQRKTDLSFNQLFLLIFSMGNLNFSTFLQCMKHFWDISLISNEIIANSVNNFNFSIDRFSTPR